MSELNFKVVYNQTSDMLSVSWVVGVSYSKGQ